MNKVRIVRCDKHNIAVEELVEVTSKKTGEKRTEWQEAGYYGHRVVHAAEQALFAGLPIGECVTPEIVSQAVKTIIDETRAALGVK